MSTEELMRQKQPGSVSKSRDDAASNAMKIGSVVAAVAGWGVGMYAGFNLLIPLLATAAVWAIGKRILGEEKKDILPAFCVQAGHLIWFAVAVLSTREWMPTSIDIAWYVVGLAWLLAKPGKAPLLFLAIYQLLSLPYNVFMFAQTDLGSVANKALLVHIIWHGLALFYMGRLYYQLSRQHSVAKISE